MTEADAKTISWRVNVSGTIAPDVEPDVLALLNGMCVALGAAGIYVSDGTAKGAMLLPIEDRN